MAQRPDFDAAKSSTANQRKMTDRVVEVVGYTKLENGKGAMNVVDHEGNQFEVTISDKTKVGAPGAEKFSGGVIDERWIKAHPAGSRVILEKCMEDGDGKLSAGWLNGAAKDPQKTVDGLITVQPRVEDRKVTGVGSVLVWSANAIDVNNNESLGNVVRALDRGVAENLARDEDGRPVNGVRPNYGFMVRLINAEGEVQQLSAPISWNRNESRPASGDDLQSWVDWLKAECEENPGYSADICLFRRYPGSKEYTLLNDNGEIERGAVSTMAQTRGKITQEDMRPAVSGLYGGRGILQVSPGQYNPATGEIDGAQNNYANRVIVSARKSHIAEAIPGANGEQLTVSPGLTLQFPDRIKNELNHGDGSQAPQQKEAPKAAAPQQQEAAPAKSEPEETPAPEAKAEQAAPRRAKEFNFN